MTHKNRKHADADAHLARDIITGHRTDHERQARAPISMSRMLGRCEYTAESLRETDHRYGLGEHARRELAADVLDDVCVMLKRMIKEGHS